MKKISLALLLVLLLSSCAHKKIRPAVDPGPNVFTQDQIKREKLFRYIQGKLDLRFRSPKFRLSGSARIYVGEKGETRLEVVDPLGRTQFIGHLAGRSFLAYWPRQERAYRDQEEGRHYLARYLGLSMTFRELIDLFWGMVPRHYRAEKPKAPWGWDEERGLFLAKLGLDEKPAELGWKNDHLAVGSLKWWTPGPEGFALRAHWEDYTAYHDGPDNILLANQLKLEAEREGILLDISWNEVESKTKTDLGHSLEPNLSDKTKTISLP